MALYSQPVLTGYSAQLDAFDWPANTALMLSSGLHLSDTRRYTEQQADDLLANALVRLKHLARGRTTSEEAFPSVRLVTAGFMPRHVLVTQGIDPEAQGRLSTRRWFSLPLLAAPPADPDDVHYLEMQTIDGRRARSLDLIRFDRFAPRAHSGFWLPTAIVRPVLKPIPRSADDKLEFRVVYQFPTSPAIFRDLFRTDPEQAYSHLRQVLDRKQAVWLSKLDPLDQKLVSNMWKRSHKSNLLPASPFFEQAERETWAARHGGSYFQASTRGSRELVNKGLPAAATPFR
uniref:Uncharacterized protein n=1 Tax=Kalmanozyma brasiliensis (strain GHG001) TaxID=1365824 RepID=V5EUK7_KALBG